MGKHRLLLIAAFVLPVTGIASANAGGSVTRFVRQQAETASPRVVLSRPDGRLPNVSVSGWPAALIIILFVGGITALVVRFAQLRRRASRLDADRETQYRALFERNPCPMFVYDMQTLEFLQANDAMLAQFAYTRQEFMRLTVLDLMAADLRDEIAQQVGALDPHAADDIITRMVRKDGREIEVDVRGRPAEIGGHVARLVIVLDITERTLLEQQLRQSQKMEAVGRLAGGIAHDFNNILTVITSYAGMLLEDHANDRDTEPLQEIHMASRRAAALTRQLLSFSRKQVVRHTPVSVNAVVTSIEPMLRRILPENIRFICSLQPEPGVISGDFGQLEQVIMNLVVNAMDAMPDGGSLTLETANAELDAEYVHRHPEVVPGSYVMLAASDTGVGMSADTLRRIFEPFFTTKEEGKGTGIGLATTYAIVKQLGGHIWVYSELANGSTFKIYLPRATAGAVDSATPVNSPAAERRSGNILLVEDDSAVRRGIREMLVRHGYDVVEASHGEAGLAVAADRAGEIDLVITDVMMPGMNGRDFANALLLHSPTLRVVFTSGYTDDEVIRRGLVEEGRSFLQKPFTADQLLRAIDAIETVGP